MRTADIISALFWLAVAGGIVASGWELRLGSLNDPGSGFLIFWVGAAMAALSLAALVAALRQPIAAGIGSLWAGLRWAHVPYVAVLLALYAWLLPWLGFAVTTVALLFLLFKTVEPLSVLRSFARKRESTAAGPNGAGSPLWRGRAEAGELTQPWSVAIFAALAATGAVWLIFGRFLGTQLPVGTLWAG